ncbi:MAG: hypothetical protein LAO55_17360 [Acidobacteriia bacterium]|nr:hypothetical protein [Terriglobia bacterium]
MYGGTRWYDKGWLALSSAIAVLVAWGPLPATRHVRASGDLAAHDFKSDAQPFETEALASRALQYVLPFSKRLRSLVNCWCVKPLARSQDSHDNLREAIKPDDLQWDLPRLHAASLEGMQHLRLLVEFGAAQPPWIKDLTGQLGTNPSVAEVVAFLRQTPDALVLLRWRPPEAPLEARLLHKIMGNVLPLRQSDQMRYVRRQLRDAAMIWVMTAEPNVPPPQGIQRAAGELLAFAETFRLFQEIDPSLAILAGSEDADEEQIAEPSTDYSMKGFRMIEDTLGQAVDLAVWDGDIPAALRLLEEACRFSERKVTSVADPQEKERYLRLLLRARQLSQDLTMAAAAFVARERGATWQQASPAGYGLLKKTIGAGLTIKVPGKGVSAVSPTGALEVIALDIGPEDREPTQAPWLYGVQFSVLQKIGAHERDKIVVVTGLPVAIVDRISGRRFLRRLRREEDESNEDIHDMALFLDLAPGIYSVQLVLPQNLPSWPREDIGGGPNPTLRYVRSRLARSAHWRWPWNRLSKRMSCSSA